MQDENGVYTYDEQGNLQYEDGDLTISQRDTGSYVISCHQTIYVIDKFAAPSGTHVLGTDGDGFDVLARVMYGGGIINKLINACADVFCQNYEAIMKGDFNSTLIKQVSGTNKEAYDACTALAYGRIYHTNMVTQIQIAGFKILGTILKEYTDAVLKPETYYARNILSIMPEQYKVSKADSMYTKIQTVVDYVSGMTDSYALNLYRKIKGIDLPEIK